MDQLLHLDYQLFQLVNQEWTNYILDIIMPFLREKKNWIPLYIAVAGLLLYQFKWKRGLLAILLAISTIGISDTLSSKIIKPNIERPRPCHDNSTIENGRLLIDCGGGYSFTSSHATNHFAIAIFLGLVVLPLFRFSFALFLAWAGSIAYAQVYVGVHYPLDVVTGGLIGAIIGYLIYQLYLFIVQKYLAT
ncbi:MAG: membrane-associated phospholipid phosphatase [Maribacter sp.]|jgi:membrane-associated phospholipid phosphatase